MLFEIFIVTSHSLRGKLTHFITMSLFEPDENFDEILAKGKRIDKGIQHLEKKLSNVKSLGVSFAPEETKNAALNVLKEYEEEVAAMKVGIFIGYYRLVFHQH